MDLIKRFFGFILNPSHRRTLGILAVLTIALAIPLTANIAQKQQEIRQHASNTCDTTDPCTGWSYPPCTTTDGVSGYHPICGSHDIAGECYPGTAPDLSKCSAPTQTTSKPACPGECTGVQTCQQVNGGTVDTNYSCTTGACCITGSASSKPLCPGTCTGVQTCQNADANGFGVAGNVDTSYRCDTQGTACCIIPGGGTTTPGICIKTCQNGQVVATGPAAACAQLPNPDCTVSPAASPATDPATAACNGLGGTCLDDGKCILGPNNYANIVCPIKTTPSAPTSPSSGSTTSGTCPQITAGGNSGAGGNCNTGDPNVNIGTCTSNKCASSGTASVLGHTISVCQFNAQAGRLCYANNPAECWPDSPCPSANSGLPTGIALTCPNGAQPVCSNGANIIKNATGNYWCPSPSNPTQDSGVAPTCPGTASAPTSPTCKTDAASATTCASSCQVVNGVNMKCNVQNQNSAGVCSGSCTGQWNCVIDSSCTNPNGTILSFGIGLDGIGTIGDVRNKTVSATRSPNHSVRTLNLQLVNSSGSVSNFNGNISYAGGTFTANVNLGSVPTGTYTVKIKSDGYLRKTIPAQLTVASGVNTYTLTGSTISLVTGDITLNNQLDINDYNILLSCSIYSNDKYALCNSNSNYRTLSDLNDDGTIDQIDYNLFLREFSTVQNGD